LLAAANTLVTGSGLTPAAVSTVVAINNQNAAPPTVGAATPAAFLQLHTLSFSNATNFYVRTLGGSAAQNTPNSSNEVKFVDRRQRSVNGNLARWGSGGD